MVARSKLRPSSILLAIVLAGLFLFELRLFFADPVDTLHFRLSLAAKADLVCLQRAIEAKSVGNMHSAADRRLCVDAPPCPATHRERICYTADVRSGRQVLLASLAPLDPQCEVAVRSQIADTMTSYLAACSVPDDAWVATCDDFAFGRGSFSCEPLRAHH